MIELSPLIYVLIFGTGFLAGFVDSVAGGGGLVAMPVLLSIGLPPTTAIATNKLQGTFGSFSAMLNYRRAKLMSIRKSFFTIVTTAIGAVTGNFAVQWLDDAILKYLVPALLVAVFFYTLFSPKIGEEDRHARLQPLVFGIIFGFALGFYDGFFGPGTGSFWTISLVSILGLNLKKATAQTKVYNFTSNIVSLVTFALSGLVVWSIGLTMGIGQILGATLGSRLVIRKGTRFVRIFFLCVVAATLIKMFSQLF